MTLCTVYYPFFEYALHMTLWHVFVIFTLIHFFCNFLLVVVMQGAPIEFIISN